MTKTRNDIADAADRMQRRGLSKQVDALPAHLEHGETVLCMAPARVLTSGLLAVTDRRAVFIKSGFISEKYSIPFDRILSVYAKSKKRITVALPERAIKIMFARKTDLQPILAQIRSRAGSGS